MTKQVQARRFRRSHRYPDPRRSPVKLRPGEHAIHRANLYASRMMGGSSVSPSRGDPNQQHGRHLTDFGFRCVGRTSPGRSAMGLRRAQGNGHEAKDEVIGSGYERDQQRHCNDDEGDRETGRRPSTGYLRGFQSLRPFPSNRPSVFPTWDVFIPRSCRGSAVIGIG